VAINEARRREIRRQYRMWRAAVDLTQEQVEQAARAIYPEFPRGAYWRIETAQDFPSPSERKALAQVLKQKERALPYPESMERTA
jgi:transcriptional regulator with XRE-family HTH domain